MNKDTVTIPVRVEKDGGISVLFGHKGGQFSLDRTERHRRILSGPSLSIMPAAAPERATAIIGIDSPLSDSNHILVAGNAAAFGDAGEDQRWVSQKDMVFGPVPEGADPATLDKLYVGALPKEDVTAMMLAVNEVRQLRLGNPARDTTLSSLFGLMAEHPQQVAIFMDHRQDTKLPPLDLRQPERAAAPENDAAKEGTADKGKGIKSSRRGFFRLGGQLLHAARIANSPDLLTAAMRVLAQGGPAPGNAAEILAHGSVPKPA